jgi:hypothetical protein
MYEYLTCGFRARFESYTINNILDEKASDRNSSFQVRSDTLDNILDGLKVDVMKIDIEGAEVLALKGAANTLRQLRKIIVETHEYNLEKVGQILESYNFELEFIGKDWVRYIIGSKQIKKV